jgi:hypothetical protein
LQPRRVMMATCGRCWPGLWRSPHPTVRSGAHHACWPALDRPPARSPAPRAPPLSASWAAACSGARR